MLFIILATDRPGSLEQRLAHRQRHLDYWNGLPGTVKLAGAMLEPAAADGTPKGSAIIVEAPDLAAAQALLAQDPFTLEGIFADNARIEVVRPALGEWKLT